MATCGEYELERAIGWGRRSTFFAARISGAKGPAVIVIRRARTVERTFRHAFLRAAAEQQAAVVAGCRRLAPILSFDCDETGFAYYATARYETSLAEFLEAGCKVDSALMREIVTGVLGALSELHEKSRRAHGNLTPGNILLDPHGHIFLTDLAPSAKDATTADDLFALGTLIYQLVRRTARIGMLNPPLDYSPEWTDSLGDDTEGWREYTNRVLTKSRNKGADALKVAAGDLKSLASLAAKAAVTQVPVAGGEPHAGVRRAPPKKRSALPKMLAIILLLAGGGGGFVWYKNHKAEQQRQIDLALKRKLQEEHDLALPTAIKDLRADLKKPLPAEIAADTTLKSLLGRIGKSLDGSGTKSDVSSLLGNWEVPDKLRVKAAAWRSAPREWTRLAGELDTAASIETDSETPVIGQLRKAIAARNDAEELDLVWGDITLILKDLSEAKNRLLPDFAPWAEYEILNAKNLADGPRAARAAQQKLREILAFQRDMGARVMWTRFEKEVPDFVQKPGNELLPAWPDKWKQEAERRVGPTEAKREEWKLIFNNAEARIPNRPAKDQPGWRKTLDDEQNATRDALQSDVAAIDRRLLVFKGLHTPEEDDYEKYEPFLRQWKATVADAVNAKDKKAALAAIDAFKKGTGDPKIAARYHTAGFVTAMQEALRTPDRISADVPGWTNITQENYDPNALILKYAKGAESVTMPFLPLDSNFAMAAFETPLILARLSGVPAGPTHDGPQIRRNGAFSPVADWFWKGPTDLQTQGIAYFAPGVTAGDAGHDYCPATWLKFSEATAVAEALGGLLPSAEQWKSALPRAGKDRRLRSAGAWAKQYPLLAKWRKDTGTPQNASAPDIGSFSRATDLLGNNNNAYLTDSAPNPNATNDGKLWLRYTPDPQWKPASGFINLIGNAAEWVSDNGNAAVIGGSVVSPPSLPTDRPIPITDRGGSYFDVTFRLVIKLGPGGKDAWVAKFEEAVRKIPAPQKPAAQ